MGSDILTSRSNSRGCNEESLGHEGDLFVFVKDGPGWREEGISLPTVTLAWLYSYRAESKLLAHLISYTDE